MSTSRLILSILGAALLAALAPVAQADEAKPAGDAPLTMASVMESATAADWRDLDPDNTLYMDLPTGRVIIELAPQFAPKHVANLRVMAHEHYFDGLAILRSQDNYVVQWGDPKAENAADGDTPLKSLGTAKAKLEGEYFRSAAGLPFIALTDPDPYAAEVGFSDGFAVGRDGKDGRAWLAHCYGTVGAGRDNASDSGSGAELYAVIGQSPRHLDRNVTLVGQVWSGMELLSVQPRGSGPLGFYAGKETGMPILSVKLATDVPKDERVPLQVLRTDSDTFKQLIEARRTRNEEWFLDPVGHLGVCNLPIPVRLKPVPEDSASPAKA